MGRYGDVHLYGVPLGPPPKVELRSTPTKHTQARPSSSTKQLYTGPTTWLYVQEDKRVYPPPRGFPGAKETGRNQRGSPCAPPMPLHTLRMRTHCLGNILHGVRPQPAPFQSSGWGWRTHRPASLTQGRGMREEGTAVQVALLRSWDPQGQHASHRPCLYCPRPALQPRVRKLRGYYSQPLTILVDK